jgi:protein-tyrosine phosphatase
LILAARWRLWRRAAAWLALLGPLFYLTYGLSNWWASTRAGVPAVVFDWERRVPFMPWTIFPYWSVNAFYALSLFLSPDRHRMDRHAARLLTAQAIAVTCFVLWPLRFSFGVPPAPPGAAGALFDALRSFDRPFNQAPSLHIALAVILWDWYRRLIHGRVARCVLHGWTLLICASVLTTWQHHFIDIPTGALLGVVCVWLWPLERVVALPTAWRWTADPRRRRLGLAYGVGAALCLMLALRLGSAALWLAWPAAACAAVALNYLGFGARGFAMGAQGRMAWPARWLLAPYRVAAALNARAWTRRLPASAPIAAGVHLGRVPSHGEWVAAGRPRMVSLCAELQLPHAAEARCVPVLDLVAATPRELQRAVAAIERERAHGEEILICCALGFSRSAAAAVAWLMRHGGHADLAAAEAQVRSGRPSVVLREDVRTLLAAMERFGDMPRPATEVAHE